MSEITFSILCLGLLMIIMGLIGSEDVKGQQNLQTEYCYMVDLYKQSSGENGWPDYRGSNSEVCNGG